MKRSSKQPRTFGRTKAKQRPPQKQQKITVNFDAYVDDVFRSANVVLDIYKRLKNKRQHDE